MRADFYTTELHVKAQNEERVRAAEQLARIRLACASSEGESRIGRAVSKPICWARQVATLVLGLGA